MILGCIVRIFGGKVVRLCVYYDELHNCYIYRADENVQISLMTLLDDHSAVATIDAAILKIESVLTKKGVESIHVVNQKTKSKNNSQSPN